jgi:hypothetical protein
MAANNLIKRANIQEEFEPWHIEELEKCTEDYIYFIKKYVKIQHPTKGTVPFELYDYQEEILHLVHNNKDAMILAARQLGKTQTISTGYILWLATFHKDKDCRIASKNMKHATEIMSRIKFSYEELPHWLKAGCKFYNRTSMEMDNGSKISTEATTEKTGRGGSPSLIFIDEIAFVSKRIQEELWASLAPSLSTGGKLILTTTPNGDTDLFARLWRESVSGQNNFANYFVTYERHPERGPGSGYYEDMLGKIGELRCRVELMCEFLSSDALLINSQRLIELKEKVPIRVDNGFRFWEDRAPGLAYLVGVDIATGTGKDFSVIQVYDFPTLRQVAEYRSNLINIPELYIKIKWILKWLSAPFNNRRPEVFWTFERNAIGEAIGALYETDEKQPEYAELVNDVNNRLGMNTNSRTKVLACLQLKTLIEKIKNGLEIKSDIAIFELKNFISSGGSYAAKAGATDDAVSALLLIARLLKHISQFDDSARTILYEYNESDYVNGEITVDSSDEPLPFVF